MRKLINKKGVSWMAREAGSLLIAVLSIVILIGVGVLILKIILAGDKDLESAKAAVNSFSQKIQEVDASQKAVDHQLFNPDGWYVMIFKPGSLPSACATSPSDFCLCICKSDSLASCNSAKTGACKTLLLNSLTEVKFLDKDRKKELGNLKIKSSAALFLSIEPVKDGSSIPNPQNPTEKGLLINIVKLQ